MEKPQAQSSRNIYTFVGIILSAYVLSYVWTSQVVPLVLKYAGNPTWQPLLLNIFYALFFGVLAVYAIRFDHLPVTGLGIGAVKVREASWIIIIGWVVLFAILIPVNLNGIGIVYWDPISIIGQWFFAAMAEELFFRGYLQTQLPNNLKKIGRPWDVVISIIITNFIFATIRLPSLVWSIGLSADTISISNLVLSVFVYFLVGLVFSYMYYRTQNLVLLGLIHGGWSTQAADSIIKEIVYLVIFILVIEAYLAIRNLRTRKEQGVRKMTKSSHRRAG